MRASSCECETLRAHACLPDTLTSPLLPHRSCAGQAQDAYAVSSCSHGQRVMLRACLTALRSQARCSCGPVSAINSAGLSLRSSQNSQRRLYSSRLCNQRLCSQRSYLQHHQHSFHSCPGLQTHDSWAVSHACSLLASSRERERQGQPARSLARQLRAPPERSLLAR